jgi:hypothetical protein
VGGKGKKAKMCKERKLRKWRREIKRRDSRRGKME